MSALSPEAARARAVRLLSELGFRETARNTRGDSAYLSPEGCAYALRVSNHARTPRQRRNHPEAIVSLVIRSARTEAQVAGMVAAAVRDFDAARARAGSQGPASEPSAAASRK